MEGDGQVSLTDTLLLPPSSGDINSDASSLLSHHFPNSSDIDGISQKNHLLNRARPRAYQIYQLKIWQACVQAKLERVIPIFGDV